MKPMYMISVRQLTGRVRLAVTILFAALPVLIAGLTDDSPSNIDEAVLNGLYAALVIPLIALATATASFGNEIEDRTLSNLTLTPVPRWKIVMPKLLAAISINGALILVSIVLSVILAYEGDATVLVSVIVAALLGIVAYSTVFMWLGLMSSRALLIGLLYVFLWELLFTQFVSGIRFLSIRAYMIGTIKGLDDTRFAESSEPIISLPVSLVVLIAVIVIFLALSIRRLRTIDVP